MRTMSTTALHLPLLVQDRPIAIWEGARVRPMRMTALTSGWNGWAILC